ncbi:hypothetical protein [Gordonia sihwensis]|uniref:hypothetical protein n=1 Tax=Gordonia sihwensis TaxID=173559 RepID=UPI003D95C928
MTTMNHPVMQCGTARVWFVASRLARLIGIITPGVMMYLILPQIPVTATRASINAGAEYALAGGHWVAVATIGLIAYLGCIAVARYCDMQAWSTIPGAFGWRNSIRDPDPDDSFDLPRRAEVIWLISRTCVDAGVAIALCSRGLLGYWVVLYVFAAVLTLSVWRTSSVTWQSSIATLTGWLPGTVIAVLALSTGASNPSLLIGTAATIGALIGITIAAVRAMIAQRTTPDPTEPSFV